MGGRLLVTKILKAAEEISYQTNIQVLSDSKVDEILYGKKFRRSKLSNQMGEHNERTESSSNHVVNCLLG